MTSSIMKFDTAALLNAGGTNAPQSGAAPQAARKPSAKLWLNAGYEKNGKFINLPLGIPVDTMELVSVRGQDAEYAAQVASMNKLIKALQAQGDLMAPGEEVEVKLTLRLRKANEKLVSNETTFDADFELFAPKPVVEEEFSVV